MTLSDNNFEVSIKPVKTLPGTSYGLSTRLRVKNLNSDFSQDYQDTFGNLKKFMNFSSEWITGIKGGLA